MGLSNESTGRAALDSGLEIRKAHDKERVIALAGNPNVGKSTFFNALTGMRQHTGNWPGKTVTCAQGRCSHAGQDYLLVDLPGCYSIFAHSAEEEAARDFICFGGADAVIALCDGTCLERSLNLALQLIEITPRVVVCINLMDEARRKHIRIDLEEIERRLGVPVVGVSARSRRDLGKVLEAAEQVMGDNNEKLPPSEDRSSEKVECSGENGVESGEKGAREAARAGLVYSVSIEEAAGSIAEAARRMGKGQIDARWLTFRLLEQDRALLDALEERLGCLPDEGEAVQAAREHLREKGYNEMRVRDEIAYGPVRRAEAVCRGTVIYMDAQYDAGDRRLDRILTGRVLGFPLMFLMLMIIFWLTIKGANAPSAWLSKVLFWTEDWLHGLMQRASAPAWVDGMLISGAYRVLAWVVSVMLPPMAIFFPMFTLLEDAGYLPRVAFNMDRCFHCCRACGKQCLTMMMGFGCNAAGVVGCRIIDSPRERLIAMLTNVFVPCNGRFPMLITLISIFLLGGTGGMGATILSAAALAGLIVLGIAASLAVSALLSRTVLKGLPSSFTLELPPYRRPQVGQVIVRSLLDRTLFVLGRAAAVAAPAGVLIWGMANIQAGGQTLLAHCAAFLDPLGRLMGMDGVILLGFILGWPANEIVLPIIIMAYTSGGVLAEMESAAQLGALLYANGWTWITAVSTMLFSLMHWPCSTTVVTMYRETKSLKWTALGVLIPTAAGVAACIAFANAARWVSGMIG